MAGSLRFGRGRNAILLLVTVCASLVFALIIAEIFLRLVPIAGICYNIAKSNELVGSGYCPGSTALYRNARGDHVERVVNRWGYLDEDHEPSKPPGKYRIGFFGDSFTLAVQVPVEDTFFGLAERDLSPYNVECLSFGVSGFSTLQSYLTCKKWSGFFNLDLIVYVFYENDLGDQIKEVKRSPNVPYAFLTPTGFGVDNSFRERSKYKRSPHYRMFDYLTAHSLVCSTIWQRVGLLIRYGVKPRLTREDMEGHGRAKDARPALDFPREGDFPSTWPDSLKTYAQDLGEAIVTQWRDEVEADGREFAILCIPRMAFEEPFIYEDSWKPWLEGLCAKEGIDLVDPSAELLETASQGNEIIYDHLTKEGHIAVSKAFVDWFRGRSRGAGAVAP